ncbi:MAG: MaoC family dehydratase N-terminal domain-containing protein [Dehalococcoidia bacterium]
MSKVITDEARALIGADLGAMTIEVDKSATRKYASAIRFPNAPEPRYFDADAAAKTKHGGLIAPITFTTSIPWLGPVLEKVNPSMGKYRVGLNGGQEYEYHAPVRPGDVLTAYPKLAKLEEKPRDDGGVMLVMTLQCDVQNQKEEPVLTARQTLLRIYGPENLS